MEMTMKIMKPHANSAQQQDNAGHFSKTLHTAKAKNQPNNANAQERANTAYAARLQAQAEVQLQAANNQQESAIAANAARWNGKAKAEDTVANITDDIRAKLARGGNITHDQLEEIASSFDELTPEQAQQVVEGLSDEELQTLAKEIKAGGMFELTGLTESERCEFIGMLASKLDAKQFRRVAEAFGDPATYAMVVAEQGSNDAKIGFINAFKEDASTSSMHGVDQYGYNDSATAIGTVLASMDAEGLSRAIGHWDEMGNYQQDGALSAEQLKTILEAGLGSVTHAMSAPPITTYYPSILNNILDNVADNGDVRMKAEVFSTASGILEGVQGLHPINGVLYTNQTQTATAIGTHMNVLLRSDTAGIIDYLEYKYVDGTAITTFAQQMLADGNTQGLGELLKVLMERNLYDEDNARDLGYLLGAIRAGLNDLNADKETQIELYAGLLGALAGSVPWFGELVGFTTEQGAKDLFRSMLGNDGDVANIILNMVMKDLPNRTPVETAYNTVVNAQDGSA
jgi:hypothetical protein